MVYFISTDKGTTWNKNKWRTKCLPFGESGQVAVSCPKLEPREASKLLVISGSGHYIRVSTL